MSETDALAFVRDALTDMRADMRDLRHAVEQSMRDSDSRFEALEICPCPRAQIPQPAQPAKGLKGFVESVSWLPTAWRFAWPAALIFVALWRTAPVDTKSQVRNIAAEAVGLPRNDVTSAASRTYRAVSSSTWVAPKQGGPR